MADDTLQQVRENLDQVNILISRNQNLISFLSDAGEDVTKLRQDLQSLIIRKNKWENALKNRGI